IVRCLTIQNRIGLEGRTRCLAEFVRLLNDLGEEPIIVCLAFHDPDIGRAFGLSGLRYTLSTLLPWAGVPSAHRPEVLVTNLLARRMIERLTPDLVFNSNNTWALLELKTRSGVSRSIIRRARRFVTSTSGRCALGTPAHGSSVDSV